MGVRLHDTTGTVGLGAERLEARALLATYHVAPTGTDAADGSAGAPFLTIQRGLDAAVVPGDTVLVQAGTYRERPVFRAGGTPTGGPITLAAAPGPRPVIDADGIGGPNEHVITIVGRSAVTVTGFEIRNNRVIDEGAAIFVSGSGRGITIRDNLLHDLRGTNAMGIAVYGTGRLPLDEVTIEGNVVHDAEPAPSEAVVVNGNVTRFLIADNHVHDVNNIGIDVIGGERDVHPSRGARDGIVRGNVVERARSAYGGGYAAGVYVDGGRRVLVEANVCRDNDLGIEVGAEHRGWHTFGVTVRGNLLVGNGKAGLVFGGYAAEVGRVHHCSFLENTVVGNDASGTGVGQVWIQRAHDCRILDNAVTAAADGRLVTAEAAGPRILLDRSTYRRPAAATAAAVAWNGRRFATLADFTRRTGHDRHSTLEETGDPAGVG